MQYPVATTLPHVMTSHREPVFSRSDFKLLAQRLEPQWFTGESAGHGHRIDADGFWPDRTADFPYNWSPLCDRDGEVRQNPMDHPALPFPFTAHQLAAFLMDGHGAVWVERLGGWDGDPGLSLVRDDVQDSELDMYGVEVVRAVHRAWAAYHEAKKIVGVTDLDEPILAGAFLPLDREARKRSADHWRAWCKRMVTQLLMPALAEPADSVIDSCGMLLKTAPATEAPAAPASTSIAASSAKPTSAPREKAGPRHDRSLREILGKLDIDASKIPFHKGGAIPSEPKKRAREMALSPEYAAQGVTARTFRAAWERLPKVADGTLPRSTLPHDWGSGRLDRGMLHRC